jgi:hypothetical protein
MNKQETSKQHPTKPVRPDAAECCNRGCENCIFVYYERALQRWQETVNQ